MPPEVTTPPPKIDISAWPRVTAILEATGIADYSKIPNAEFYLQRGSDVHMVCESIDRGEPDYWTGTDLEGYANAWKKFKDEAKFQAELIEHPVYHENRRYKGTLDRTGRFGNFRDRVLLDLKSGIVADWVKLQTAAYAACLDQPEGIIRYGLQLKKDGNYKLSEPFKDYRSDSNYFFSLVSTVHGRTIYGKTEILEGE
jgi:hypothetical protein